MKHEELLPHHADSKKETK